MRHPYVCLFAAILLSAALAAPWFSSPSSGATPAAIGGPVRVDLESVLIQRFKLFAAGKDPAAESQMKVRLQGRMVQNLKPIDYYDVSVEQAMDDTGLDVIRGRKNSFFGMETTPITAEERQENLFSFDLPSMALPKPTARKLKALTGSLKIRVAESVRPVKLPGLAKGKAISSPSLKDLRGQIAQLETRRLVVTMTGKVDSVIEVAVSMADVVASPTSTQFSREGDKATWTLDYDKELPANAALVVSVAEKVQEIQVPFKFENVELP